jgi:uncharacterized membrane protein (Fun14 family)
VVQLSTLDGMNLTQHLGSICKGAGIGLLIGLASIATVDKKTLVVLHIVTKPVELVMWLAQKTLGLSDGSAAFMGWFGTAIYMMILGGLIGWGVSVLLAKASGDE